MARQLMTAPHLGLGAPSAVVVGNSESLSALSAPDDLVTVWEPLSELRLVWWWLAAVTASSVPPLSYKGFKVSVLQG